MSRALYGFEFFLILSAMLAGCGGEPAKPKVLVFDIVKEHVSVHGEIKPNVALTVEEAKAAVQASVDLLEAK